MHIIDVNCTGSELTLLDCPYNSLTSVSGICGQYKDASIICQGNILCCTYYFFKEQSLPKTCVAYRYKLYLEAHAEIRVLAAFSHVDLMCKIHKMCKNLVYCMTSSQLIKILQSDWSVA